MLLGADQSIARKYNRAQLLNRLRVQGSASRADLARQTGLTRSTISRIIDDLIEEKLVYEITGNQQSIGRPGTLLALNPTGGSAIGVKFGVHFISIILTDFISTPLWNERLELPESVDPETYISTAESLIRKAMGISKQKNLTVKGLGVTINAMINTQTQVILIAPDLKWLNISIVPRWAELFDVPIIIENETNASTLGEYYFGNGQGIEDFIYINLDIVAGAGIFSKGRIFHGVSGYAGGIGHISIDPKGELCQCGRRGCLETKVSRYAIIERYKKLAHLDEISLEQIIQRGQAGDPFARKIFEEVGVDIGLGISFIINLLNPAAVIFGRTLGQAFNLILPSAQRTLSERCFPGFFENLLLRPSMIGSDNALYGCIALVLDEIIRETI